MNEDGLREPHPFTIAAADNAQGQVSFAIRSIGDFTTRLVASAKVGTSGKASTRVGAATAKMRNWPFRAYEATVPSDTTADGTCPAIKSAIAGPPPLYGTCSMFAPVSDLNNSAIK